MGPAKPAKPPISTTSIANYNIFFSSLHFLLLAIRMTPPPCPVSIPETPIHMMSKTTERFDRPFYNRDTILQRLSREMAPFFIGPISPRVFLDSFLPMDPPVHSSSTFKPGILSELEGLRDKGHLQTIFVCPNSHHSVLLKD